MQLRRFNDAGVSAFAAFLDALRKDGRTPVPVDLLQDPGKTAPLTAPVQATPPASFPRRMDFARWLHDTFQSHHAAVPRDDPGFWAWLSLALFDHVCPPRPDGRRKPHANERYIVSGQWTRSYRHLLQNPYEVFFLHRDNPDRALVALVNPLSSPGELTENICGRRDLMSCPGAMALATYLCVDTAGNRRPGASGEFANIFGKFVRRLSRTWDLPLMPPEFAARLLHQKKLRRLVEAAQRNQPQSDALSIEIATA